MDNKARRILVTGATGHQGGAVARHLLAADYCVRILTRDPSKPAARELALAGVEVSQGDMEDAGKLVEAMRDCYGAFSVQQFWETGVDGEIRQGKNVADAAKRVGLEHFVYTSVGGAERQTGIPHFDSKWKVEEHIREIGLPCSIVRPVFFMENLLSPQNKHAIQQGRVSLPLPGDKPLQMIAVSDIGGIVATIFSDREQFLGKAIEIAGDELTMQQVCEMLSETVKHKVAYEELPIEQMRRQSPELAVMFEWFVREGYTCDIRAIQQFYPGLKSFRTFLREMASQLLEPSGGGNR